MNDIEQPNRKIVINAVNGDPKRMGIRKVVFRFGTVSVESTQQVRR